VAFEKKEERKNTVKT